MDIDAIKRDGQIAAIKQVIRARQHKLSTCWEGTEQFGRYNGLGLAIRRAQTHLSDINELLKVLQQLDPKVT